MRTPPTGRARAALLAAALTLGGAAAAASSYTGPAPMDSYGMTAGTGSWLHAPVCGSPAPFSGGACLSVARDLFDPYDPTYQYDLTGGAR